MGANDQVADVLDNIARMLEVLGEDGFRAIAHSRAARLVSSLPGDVKALAKDRTALIAIKGIGPKIADKIIERGVEPNWAAVKRYLEERFSKEQLPTSKAGISDNIRRLVKARS